MASVWIQRKGKAEKKLADNLHPVDAIKLFHHQLSIWSGEVSECPDHSFHAFLHYPNPVTDKISGPASLLWIEFHSPPSAPEKGQPKRKEAKS